MVNIGILFSLVLMPDPSILVRPLAFSRGSLRFKLRLGSFVVLVAIPVGLLMNPLWWKIDMEVKWLAILLWICQSIAFFMAMVVLIIIAPRFQVCCAVDLYGECEYGDRVVVDVLLSVLLG